MSLELLYKRAKTGKIVYYKIWVDGDTILKETGQLGTDKPVTHKEVCTPKNVGKSNETTGHEQAVSQSLSDWNKKRDEGYKSRKDLNIEISGDLMGYRFNYVNFQTLSGALNIALPEFNTDASGNPKPMLATDWKKIKKINYPVLVQPKLDGVRCLMIVNVDNGTLVTFLSRSGKEYTTLSHIEKDIVAKSPKESFILDGEIYSDELTFQEIIAAVKKQRPESLKLKFRAYDTISAADQGQRWDDTVALVDRIASPEIQLVPTWVANNEEEVKAHHDTWVQEGYEGAMIRLYGAPYTQGQRSRELLKVKEFDETEYYFQRWEKGLRDEDLIAVCWTSILADDSKEFKAKMVGTIAEKKELELSTPKADSLITIKHFGLTEDGLPRFPIGKAFRHDL
jgi:ATP-dependent DNA ligase